jgi:hypothetical protein
MPLSFGPYQSAPSTKNTLGDFTTISTQIQLRQQLELVSDHALHGQMEGFSPVLADKVLQFNARSHRQEVLDECGQN